MLGIVVSRADRASVTIGEQLLALEDWVEADDGARETVYRTEGAVLREFEQRHLDMTRPADAFGEIDLLVFASKHSGETGPLLTAHHTGNFGPADYGGDPNSLAEAAPNAHAFVLDSLDQYAPDGYEVGMECTHHGPSEVGVASMFVELGSASPQWEDAEAARAVASAILDLRGVSPHRDPAEQTETRRQLVGFGGGHYTPRFERVVRETDWAVGHIAADWGLDAIAFDGDVPVIAEAFEQSKAAYALVDGDRPEVVEAVKSAGYRAVGETWVRETDGLDLAFVSAAEEIATVQDGLRFGDQAGGYEGESFTAVDLPEQLLDTACGIDREQTYSQIAARALAFCTSQGGTRPTETVLLAETDQRDAIIDKLLSVLATRYDSVECEDGTVVARERRFDPEKAKTLGVPEGPAFGKLSAGDAVDVGGRTIPPETVQTEHVDRFSLW